MTDAPKKIRVDAAIRPLVDRLCATDDPAEIKKIATKLRRLVRGGRMIKRLRLDLVPPRNRIEAKKWVESRYQRKLRTPSANHPLGRKRLPPSEKRRLITPLVAEAKELVRANGGPRIQLTADDCMRKHRRDDDDT
jgi:hypothetical protein